MTPVATSTVLVDLPSTRDRAVTLIKAIEQLAAAGPDDPLDPAIVGMAAQDLANAYGGTAELFRLTPAATALYLMVLFLRAHAEPGA